MSRATYKSPAQLARLKKPLLLNSQALCNWDALQLTAPSGAGQERAFKTHGVFVLRFFTMSWSLLWGTGSAGAALCGLRWRNVSEESSSRMGAVLWQVWLLACHFFSMSLLGRVEAEPRTSSPSGATSFTSINRLNSAWPDCCLVCQHSPCPALTAHFLFWAT